MVEPRRERRREADRQAFTDAVRLHTLRVLGLPDRTTPQELQAAGYPLVRLSLVHPGNFDGVARVEPFVPGAPFGNRTGYVFRGTLAVGERNNLSVRIAGDRRAVINVGSVGEDTAILLRAGPLQVIGVAQIKGVNSQGIYEGRIDPSVLILPSEQQQTPSDLIEALKNAARTTRGREVHTSQRDRLPDVRALIGRLITRTDLTGEQVRDVRYILELIPEQARPVWGNPADLQVVQASIDAYNQSLPLMGQRPRIADISQISCAGLKEFMQLLTRIPNPPPMEVIGRILQYNLS